MNKLIQIIKNIKFRQVLTVFLAGSLLVLSTACSQGNMAQTGGKVDTDMGKRAMSDTYDDYDANQSFEGGMNGYNDDRRYDGETSAKAKELVDTAKSRQADNIGDYVDNITNRAQDNFEEAKREVPSEIKDNTKDAIQDVKQRSQTLKSNVSDASKEAKNTLDEATDTAREAAEDTAQASKEAAEDTAQASKEAAEDTIQASKDTAKELKDNLEDLS